MTPQAPPADPILLRKAMTARAERIRLARHDFETFARLVLVDERSGKPIKLAPMHREWLQLVGGSAGAGASSSATATALQLAPPKGVDRLVLWASVESGKSSLLTVGRTLFVLGQDPNTRVVIAGKTVRAASKLLRTIAKYINESAALREVFPDLLPGSPWTTTELVIKRPGYAKDPSVRAVGVDSSVVGSRIDLLILDDVCDLENTRTPDLRDKMNDWYHSEIVGRLTVNSKVLCVANPYHRDDLPHRLSRNPAWVWRKYPALVDDGKGGQVAAWPEIWPLDRIEKKRIELGPIEFARQMLCRPRDDDSARIKEEWIRRCMARGAGKQPAWALRQVPPGYHTHTGVDLAMSKKDSADLTAFTTLLIHPDGTREILSVEAGRYTGPEIIAKIKAIRERFQSIVTVESNGGQAYIAQFLATEGWCRAFMTGQNKTHPEFGLEGVATELYNGKWVIPNVDGVMHPEIDALVQEMLMYDPKSHTGDRFMSAWLAREGAREGPVPEVQSGYVNFRRR